jgi:UDP-N-acetylglucosamine 2-epimerase
MEVDAMRVPGPLSDIRKVRLGSSEPTDRTLRMALHRVFLIIPNRMQAIMKTFKEIPDVGYRIPILTVHLSLHAHIG